MKLVLRDNYIYIVESTGLANNKVEAEVVTQFVPDYTEKYFEYRINKGKFQPIKNGKIKFDKEDLEKGYIDITVRATQGKEIEVYKSDRQPVTFAVVFGKSITKAYPEAIQMLYDRMDRMDAVLVNLIDTMEEVSKKGELL